MADRIIIPENSSKDLKLNNTKALDSKELNPVVKNDIITNNEKEKEVVKAAQPTNKSVEDFTSSPASDGDDDATFEECVPESAIIGDELDKNEAEKIDNDIEEEPTLDLDDSENSNLTEEQYAALEMDENYGYFYDQQSSNSTTQNSTTSNPILTSNEIIKTVGDFAHPTNKKGTVNSQFGFRILSLKNIVQWEFHGGIDICGFVEGKSSVYAIADGVITKATTGVKNMFEYTKPYPSGIGNGNELRYTFKHEGKTYEVICMHLYSHFVKLHDKVVKGQAIGTIGNTGFSGGCHLHFEIRCMSEKEYYTVNYKNGYGTKKTENLSGNGTYGVKKVEGTDLIKNVAGYFVSPKKFFSY